MWMGTSSTALSFGVPSGEIILGFGPANSLPPVVSGDIEAGGSVSTTIGTWVGDPIPVLDSVAWQYSSDGVGAADGTIPGATELDYDDISDDYIGAYIRSAVTMDGYDGLVTSYSDWYGPIEDVHVAPIQATVRSYNVVTEATRTTTVFNKPAGTAENDGIIISFLHGGLSSPADPTAPSGFTKLHTFVHSDGGWFTKQHVYFKKAGASEPSTYSFTHGSQGTEGFIAACENGGNVKLLPSNSGMSSGNVSSYGFMPPDENQLFLNCFLSWQASGVGTPPDMTRSINGPYLFLFSQETGSEDIIRSKVFASGNSSFNPYGSMCVLLSSQPVGSLIPVLPFYADETNTGTTGTLTPSGTVTTTANGQVIENLDITGQIRIVHDNVTVRNCRINAAGFVWGIDGHYITPRTGLIVEYCEIHGSMNSAVLFGENSIIRYNNIWGQDNGIMIGGGHSTIFRNYIHDLAATSGPEPHFDAIQGGGGWTDIVIEGNHCISWDTSDILLQCEFGPWTRCTIKDNILDLRGDDGTQNGAAHVYLRGWNPGDIEEAEVIGNLFLGTPNTNFADLTNGPLTLIWDRNVMDFQNNSLLNGGLAEPLGP